MVLFPSLAFLCIKPEIVIQKSYKTPSGFRLPPPSSPNSWLQSPMFQGMGEVYGRGAGRDKESNFTTRRELNSCGLFNFFARRCVMRNYSLSTMWDVRVCDFLRLMTTSHRHAKISHSVSCHRQGGGGGVATGGVVKQADGFSERGILGKRASIGYHPRVKVALLAMVGPSPITSAQWHCRRSVSARAKCARYNFTKFRQLIGFEIRDCRTGVLGVAFASSKRKYFELALRPFEQGRTAPPARSEGSA